MLSYPSMITSYVYYSDKLLKKLNCENYSELYNLRLKLFQHYMTFFHEVLDDFVGIKYLNIFRIYQKSEIGDDEEDMKNSYAFRNCFDRNFRVKLTL